MNNAATELEVLKNTLVTQMFADMADQDYIVARWSFQKGLYTNFFWSAGQSIEKYLKASLLLNGKSAKNFGHDLQKLYSEVEIYAHDLLPRKLTIPKQILKSNWIDETPDRYLQRIKRYTSSSARYHVYGFVATLEDLCHLDQLIFAIRRISFGLHLWPFLGKQRDGPPQTVRERLLKSPNYSPRGKRSKFYEMTGDEANTELRHAGLNINFPFAPKDYDHDGTGILGEFTLANPALSTLILGPAEKGTNYPGRSDRSQLADWVVANIKLSRDEERQLNDAAKKLRQ